MVIHTHCFAGNYDDELTPIEAYYTAKRKLNNPADQRMIRQAVEKAVDEAIDKALDDLLKQWN